MVKIRNLTTLWVLCFCSSFFGQNTATFTTSPAAVSNTLNLCAGSQVLFTNTTAGAINSISWTFPGGSPSTSNAVGPHIVTFANPGTYTVSLSINSGPATTMQVVIQASNPSSNLGLTLNPACPAFGTSNFNGVTYFTSCTQGAYNGSYMCFTTSSTNTNANSVHTINWGNGTSNSYTGTNNVNPGFGTNISSAGSTFITYSLQQNPNSCINSQIYPVYAGSNPTALVTPGGIPVLCNPSSVTYNILPGQQNTAGTTYSVSFNDGTAPVVFNHPPPASFQHIYSNVSCGTNSVINGITYQNSFQASITAQNACGSSSNAIGPINIQSAPDAQMSTTPNLGQYNNNVCQGSSVIFNDVSNPGTNISTSSNPITCNNTYSRIWRLYGPSGLITASNGQVNITGNMGSTVNGNLTSLLSYGSWPPSIFVDQNITVQFVQPGNYCMVLYVAGLAYNPCGIDSTTIFICVTPDFQVNITSPFVSGCAPLTGVFQNNSTPAQCNLNNVAAWSVSSSNPNACGQPAWAYTNNTNGQSANPSISFTAPGVYTVQLTNSLTTPVLSNTSPLGCQAKTTSVQITVKGPPVATLTAPPAICLGSPFNPSVSVNNCYSNQTPTYAWDFNPNATPLASTNVPSPDTSNALNPGAISYPNPGTFPFSFTTINECGATLVNQNVVVQNPAFVTPGSYGPFCINTPVPLSGVVAGSVQSGFWTSNTAGGSFSVVGSGGVNSGALNSIYTPPSGFTGNILLTLTSTQPPAPCPIVTGQTTLTFNPNAIANANSYPNGICAGQSLTLNGSIGGAASSASWTSNVGGSFSNPSSLSSTWTPPAGFTGNAILTLTTDDPAGPCTPAVSNITVLVKPLPVASSSLNVGPICSGTNAVITVSSSINPSTFAWSTAVPVGVVAASSGTLNSGSATATLSTPIINNTSAPHTLTYVFTPTSNGCAGTPTSTNVTVQPVASTGPFNPITACPNTLITPPTFTSIPNGASYTWTNSNLGIGLSGSGSGQISAWTAPSNVNNNNPGTITGTITVTPSFNNCPGTPSTFLVTIYPTPTITNSPLTQSICSGAQTSIVSWSPNPAGAPTSFNWTGVASSASLTGYSNSGSGQLSPMVISNSGNTPETVTYTVTPTRNGCSGPSVSYTINVNPIPSLTLSANQTICGGTTSVLSTFSNSVAGGSYTYSLITTPPNTVTGYPTSGTGQIPAAIINNSGTNSYTLQYTVTPTANGCNGTPGIYSITVNPAPVTTFSQGPQSICSGTNSSPVSFNSTTPNVSFAWQVSVPNGISGISPITGTGNLPSFTQVTTTNTTVQSIQFSVVASTQGTVCAGPTATYTINILPIPVANPLNSATYCHGTSIPAQALNSNVATATYNWAMSNNIGYNPLSGSGASIPSFNANNVGFSPLSSTVTVTPSLSSGGTNCPGNPITYQITVNPIPQVTNLTNQVVCAGQQTSSVLLGGTVVGSNYTWTNNNINTGLAASGSSTVPVFVGANATNGPVVSTVTVTPTFTNNQVMCNGATASFSITINPAPGVVPVVNQQVCAGNNVSINFASPSNIAGTVFNWTNSNTAIGLSATGTGNLNFTATNAGSSALISTIIVTPSFSNGGVSCPGINDTFQLVTLPTPIANALTNQVLCAGNQTAAISFSSNLAGTLFNWTSSNTVIGTNASGSGNIGPFNAVNSGTAPASSTITVTPVLTTNGQTCSGNPVSVIITVNPVPIMSTPASLSFCQGSTVSYTFSNNIPSGVSYAWNNNNTSIGLAASGSGNLNFQAVNVTTAAITGTIDVTPTYTSNNVSCAGAIQSFSIQVVPSPVVDALSPLTFCHNASSNAIIFTSPVAGATFAWTNANTAIGLGANGSGNIPVFTATNSSASATLTSSVSVSASLTMNGVTCTGNPTVFTITVNPNTQPNPVSNLTLCNGSNSALVSLTGTGTSFVWTNSNTNIGLAASGNGDIASFIAANGGSAPLSGTVTVTSVFTGGGIACNGSSTSFTITVNPTPSVTAPNAVVVCHNALTTAIGFVGSGTQYTWTNNQPGIGLAASGSGNIPSFTAINTTTSPIIATINVTPVYLNNNVSCSGTVQSFTITVNPSPQVTFAPTQQTICSGTSSTLVTLSSTTPNAIITWSTLNVPASISGVNTASGGTTIPAYTLINSSATPQTVQFTASASNTGIQACPGSSVTYTITVNPTPSVTAPNNQVVCANSPTAGVSFNGNANVYNWSNNTTSIGLGASGSGNIASFLALNNTFNVVTATLTVTPQFLNNNVGCNGAATTFTYTVNPIPNSNAISSQTLCNGNNSTSITLGGTATSYAWTNSNTGIGLQASGSNTVPVFQATNGGTTAISGVVSIVPTFVNLGVSCTGPTTSYTVTVNPTPNVSQVANQVVCNNAPTTAVNFTGSGTAYQWSNSNALMGLASSGVGNIPVFTAVNASNAAPTNALVTVTPVFVNNGVTCSGPTTSYTYTINPTPVVTAVSNQVVCNGTSTSLVAFSGTATQYNWTNNNTGIGLGAANSGNINPFTAVNPTGNPIVAQLAVVPVYTGNNLSCAGSPQPFSITVNPTPTVSQPGNQVVCNGQPILPVNFSGSATSFNWTNGVTSIGLVASGSGNIPVFNAINASNAPITSTLTVQPIFTGTNLNCPGITQTFTITVNPTPTMSSLSNQVLCNGTSTNPINFTGTATSYAWSNNTPTIGLSANGSGNIAAFTAVNASNNTALTATISVTPQFVNAGLTCSGSVQQATIIVNPTPTVVPNPDLTFCQGTTTPVISFSGSGSSYPWVNNQTSIGLLASGTGNIASFNASNATTLPLVATIDVTPVFSGNGISCNGTMDQFTITVNPNPTVSAIANQTICNGAQTTAVSFAGSVPGTVFNWTNNTPSIGLIASGSGNIAAFNAVNLGNNPVVAQISVTPVFSLNGVSCPGNTQSFSITVNPTPTVNFSSSNQTICSQSASSSVTITSPTNSASIAWTVTSLPNSITGMTSNSGAATIPAFTLTNSSSTPQTIQISASAFTPGNVACQGGGTPYTITVNPTPNAAPPANQVLCHNTQSTQVAFSGTGTGYVWTNNQPSIGLAASGNGTIIPFNATNPSTSTPITATVSVTPQFVNNSVTCSGPVQNFTITVNPLPVVNTIPNQTYCNGVNSALIGISGSGTSYAWTNSTTSIGLGASGAGSILPFTTINQGTTPVNATLSVIPSYTQLGLTCNGPTSTFTFTVNPTPSVNGISNQVICNNATTASIGFSGTGTAYLWANNTPTIGIGSSGTGNIPPFTALNPSNSTPSIATLTVTPQYTNNGVACTGNSTNFTLTVNPTPVVNSLSNQTLCNGANTTQVTFTGTGTSYSWTNSLPSIGLGANGTGTINSFTAVNNGVNPVSAQFNVIPIYLGSGVSCSGQAQNFSITVNPTPSVQVPTNQVICNGGLSNGVNFSGNGTGYTWTNSNPSIGLNSNGSGNIPSFTALNLTQNPVIATLMVSPTYAGGNASCPGSPQSFTVTVNPTPTVDPISSQVVCNNTPTAAVQMTGTGTSYAWANNTPGIGLNGNGTGNIGSFTATNANISNPLVGTITVTPQYLNAGLTCSGPTQQFTVTVNPTPVTNPINNVTVCNGSNTPVVNFTGSGTTYNWSNNNNTIGLVPSGTGSSLASFQAINLSTQSVNAQVTVSSVFTGNGLSCPGTSTNFTLFVSPTPTVNIPNNQVVCNGLPTTAVNFTGTVAGTTFNWTNSISTIGIPATGSGNIPSFNAVNNGNAAIYAQVITTPQFVQNTVSCPGAPQSFTYQINPTPSATNPGNQYVCAGLNTNALTFTGTATTYPWIASNPTIGIGSNGVDNIPSFIGINNGNAPVSSQVTITPTFTQGISCVGQTQTFTFNVLPIPSVAPIPNQSHCHQAAVPSLNIAGSGTSYSWSNSNTAIGLVASGGNVINGFNANNLGTSPLTGNVSITPVFTFQGQSCNGPSYGFAITVNPLPYANALNDTVICNNQFTGINIGTNIPSNVSWYATANNNVNGELVTTQSSSFINDSLSNTSAAPQFVNYTITPTSLAGCTGPDSNVTVQVQPDVLLNIPQSIEICSGAGVNVVLGANVPSTFTWFCSVNNPNVSGESITTNSSSVISDVLINTTNQNQAVVYSVTPSSIQGNCSGPSQTVTVVVKPPLALLNADTVTICSGGNVNLPLVANTNVTFNWFASPNVNVLNETTTLTTSSIINDQLINPTGVVEEVTYSVIGTSQANGCSSPVIPITVFVNPIPLVNPNPDLNVCHNQWNPQVLFSGNAPGAVYTWNAAGANVGLQTLGGVDSLNAFIATNLGVAPISATIIVSPLFTANNVSCAGAKDTFQIVVNPEPSVFALNNMTLCEGVNSAIVPLLGPIGGTTFNWVNSNAAVGLASTGTGNVPVFMAQNPTALPIQSVVTVTPVFINGATQCSGISQTYTITVNPTPNVLTQQVSICSGQAVNMNLLADIPSTFQWDATPNPNVVGETYSPTQTSSLINDVLIQTTNAPQTIQYHVAALSVPFGCLGPDSIMTVTINPWPNVAFNALNPPYCDLTPIAFQNMSVGAYDYNWDFDDGSSAFVSNPTHQFPSQGTYNVVLTATDPNTGCIDSVMQPVTISPTPNPDFSYSDSIGCGLLDVVYTAAVYNPSWNYVWNFGNGTSTEQVGQVGYQFTQQGCYDISLTVTNPQGCTATETNFNVACVYESPVAVAGADPTEVTTLEPLVEFTNNSENASSYEWNFGDGTYGFGFEPIHLFPAEPADYVVSLVAMNEVGCTDTAYVSIHVEENLIYYVPNSFTPNDDEKNQVFLPIISQGFKPGTYLLRIFNRWGELVFESRDPYTGWGGDYGPTHTNCQSGTYTWVLNFQVLQSQEDKEYVGHLNLIK